MFDNLDKGDKNGLECALWTLKTNQTDDAMRGVTPPADGDAGDIIGWCESIVETTVSDTVDDTCETVNGYTSNLVKPPEETDPFEKMRALLTDDSNFFEQVENWKKFMGLAADTVEDIRKYFFEDRSTSCEETIDHLQSIERDLGDWKTGWRLGNWEKVKEQAE